MSDSRKGEVVFSGQTDSTRSNQVVASYSDQFVVIADYRKASNKLGEAWNYVPIEVLALAYRPIMARIEKELGGRCEVGYTVSALGIATFQVRMAKAKAGPVVTDNGGMIIDWYYNPGDLQTSYHFAVKVLGQAAGEELG